MADSSAPRSRMPAAPPVASRSLRCSDLRERDISHQASRRYNSSFFFRTRSAAIKDFAVTVEIMSEGVELDVYGNDDKHLGDLVVTKTPLVQGQHGPGKRKEDLGGQTHHQRAVW